VLLVGAGPGQLAAYFRRVVKVADGGPDTSVWLCEGGQISWASLWPRLRSLEVGS
jgi:hypothetical protein